MQQINELTQNMDSKQNQVKLLKNELAIANAELRQAISRVSTLEKEITEMQNYGLNKERLQKITETAKMEANSIRIRDLERK